MTDPIPVSCSIPTSRPRGDSGRGGTQERHISSSSPKRTSSSLSSLSSSGYRTGPTVYGKDTSLGRTSAVGTETEVAEGAAVGVVVNGGDGVTDSRDRDTTG